MKKNRQYLPRNTSWEDFQKWVGEQKLTELQKGEKSARHLFEELQLGESKLYKHNDDIYREISLVKMQIHHPKQQNTQLIETSQYLPQQKSWRQRHIPPSEKLQCNEKAEDAAVRGLKEELAFPEHQHYRLVFRDENCEERVSKSYHGVRTLYQTFRFDVYIQEMLFQEKYEIQEKDGKIAIFEWRTQE